MTLIDIHLDMSSKCILITGASGGIGGAIAEVLGSCRATLGLHYRSNRERVELIAKKVEESGGRAIIIQSNLDGEQDSRLLLDEFVANCGRIDGLINNAGAIVGAKPFLELDEDSWQKTMLINAQIPFFLSQAAMKTMINAGISGKIINISSISSKYGGGETSMHYGAAKAALEAISKGMARFGARHGILVNVIQAGFVDTDIHFKMGRNEQDIIERIKKIPLKRAGKPVEIAYLAAFLMSDMADYITGETFTIAGGD